MDTPNNKGRRKVLLINPAFQLRVLAFFGGISVVTILSFFAANRYFFSAFMNKGRALGLSSDHVFFQFIADQQHTMDIVTLAISISIMTFLFISGLILSHRVAGPLYKLTKHLNEIKDGKPAELISFRKNDYFQELVTAINGVIRRS